MSDRLIVDPVTDDRETAAEAVVYAPAPDGEWELYGHVAGHEAVRALYRAPSARPYGEGSYTVSRADYERLAGRSREGKGRKVA